MMSTTMKGVLALVPALWIGTVALTAQAPSPPAGPAQGRGAVPAQGRGAVPAPGRAAGSGRGPVVDAAAADRGRHIYALQCLDCHGAQARGTSTGSNIVRSVLFLHDRYGSELGPFLKKGHPTQTGVPSASFTDAQVVDLANFLRQRLNDTLRGSPIFRAQNVLTGNAKAGAAFFTGAGGCTACHSATGDMAGIGERLTPIDIQQRMLFPPRAGRGRAPSGPARATTVTVTPAGGAAVSGTLVQIDDFTVALREASGAYHSFRRSPTLQVEKHVPLAAHIALLDTITDPQIHDLVSYLESLK